MSLIGSASQIGSLGFEKIGQSLLSVGNFLGVTNLLKNAVKLLGLSDQPSIKLTKLSGDSAMTLKMPLTSGQSANQSPLAEQQGQLMANQGITPEMILSVKSEADRRESSIQKNSESLLSNTLDLLGGGTKVDLFFAGEKENGPAYLNFATNKTDAMNSESMKQLFDSFSQRLSADETNAMKTQSLKDLGGKIGVNFDNAIGLKVNGQNVLVSIKDGKIEAIATTDKSGNNVVYKMNDMTTEASGKVIHASGTIFREIAGVYKEAGTFEYAAKGSKQYDAVLSAAKDSGAFDLIKAGSGLDSGGIAAVYAEKDNSGNERKVYMDSAGNALAVETKTDEGSKLMVYDKQSEKDAIASGKIYETTTGKYSAESGRFTISKTNDASKLAIGAEAAKAFNLNGKALVYTETLNNGAMRQVVMNDATGKLAYIYGKDAKGQERLVVFGEAGAQGISGLSANIKVESFSKLATKEQDKLMSSLPVMDARDNALIMNKLMDLQGNLNKALLEKAGYKMEGDGKQLTFKLGSEVLKLNILKGVIGIDVDTQKTLCDKNGGDLVLRGNVITSDKGDASSKEALMVFNAKGAFGSELMKSAGIDSKPIPNDCTIMIVEDKDTAKCVVLDSEHNVKVVFEVKGDAIQRAENNMKLAGGDMQVKGVSDSPVVAGRSALDLTGLGAAQGLVNAIAIGVKEMLGAETADKIQGQLNKVNDNIGNVQVSLDSLKVGVAKLGTDDKVMKQMLDSPGFDNDAVNQAIESLCGTKDVAALAGKLKSLTSLAASVQKALDSGNTVKAATLLVKLQDSENSLENTLAAVTTNLDDKLKGATTILKDLSQAMRDPMQAPQARLDAIKTLKGMMSEGAISVLTYTQITSNIISQVKGQDETLRQACLLTVSDIKSCMTDVFKAETVGVVDIVKGAVKGSFIDKPNLENKAGQALGTMILMPAAITRDMLAGGIKVFETGGKEGKLDLGLNAVGISGSFGGVMKLGLKGGVAEEVAGFLKNFKYNVTEAESLKGADAVLNDSKNIVEVAQNGFNKLVSKCEELLVSGPVPGGKAAERVVAGPGGGALQTANSATEAEAGAAKSELAKGNGTIQQGTGGFEDLISAIRSGEAEAKAGAAGVGGQVQRFSGQVQRFREALQGIGAAGTRLAESALAAGEQYLLAAYAVKPVTEAIGNTKDVVDLATVNDKEVSVMSVLGMNASDIGASTNAAAKSAGGSTLGIFSMLSNNSGKLLINLNSGSKAAESISNSANVVESAQKSAAIAGNNTLDSLSLSKLGYIDKAAKQNVASAWIDQVGLGAVKHEYEQVLVKSKLLETISKVVGREISFATLSQSASSLKENKGSVSMAGLALGGIASGLVLAITGSNGKTANTTSPTLPNGSIGNPAQPASALKVDNISVTAASTITNFTTTMTDKIIDTAKNNITAVMPENYKNNTKATLEIFSRSDSYSVKTQIAVGFFVSSVSGDMNDKQITIEYDSRQDAPAILYINGMKTNDKVANNTQDLIQDKTGYKIARIENNTHSFPFGDGLQSLGYETGTSIDVTAIRAADAMKQAISEKGSVYVIAHSQGSAIFNSALQLLTPEERSNVHYQGFGPEKYINASQTGIAESYNCEHVNDIVPQMGNEAKKVVFQRIQMTTDPVMYIYEKATYKPEQNSWDYLKIKSDDPHSVENYINNKLQYQWRNK
jgi:hypothetical protein